MKSLAISTGKRGERERDGGRERKRDKKSRLGERGAKGEGTVGKLGTSLVENVQ